MMIQWSTGLRLKRVEEDKMLQRILLVEDNIQASNVVRDYLSKRDFEVITAYDGIAGLLILEKGDVDLVLLDAMMPGIDGFSFCKKVREYANMPIIMITGLSDEENILKGYDVGVDDYVTKPFSLAVLLAKIIALLKRKSVAAAKSNVIEYGTLKIDINKHTIDVDSEVKKLTKKEYEILLYLIENKGQILTREQILARVWNDDYAVYDRVVDTHIKKLRAILKEEAFRIETVVGVGYMWKDN